MIEDPAGDPQRVLAAAEQLAFGRQALPVGGDCHHVVHFIAAKGSGDQAKTVLWTLVTGTIDQARSMRRLIR